MSTSSQRPVLIMAGGTGGHVFPGLAVAESLRQRGAKVVWLGSRNGMEARLVARQDIPMEWIEVSGVRGKGVIGLVRAPLMLARAAWQATSVLRRLRPLAAVGMGGFVSGPGGVMAALLRVPLLVHEQNAVAGWTNKLLARFAQVVFEAFPGSFPPRLMPREVGNPVRSEIVGLPTPEQRGTGRHSVPRILVLGGSQGALALNEMVPEALALLAPRLQLEVRHQAGERMLERAAEAYRRAGVTAQLEPFIEDMAAAYAWSDLVLCRSGALTVSELAAAGVGSVLVPFPHAVDDHQTANARFLADAGAALLIQQAKLDPTSLAEVLESLCTAPGKLAAMAVKARRLARTDAAERVADEVLRHAR